MEHNRIGIAGNINEEPPDILKSGMYLRIGIFDEREDGTVVLKESLNSTDVRTIIERHADRNRAGALIRGKAPRDGNGVTLGFIEGVPIVLRAEGELHVPELKPVGARFEDCFAELCVTLRCAMCLQTVDGPTSRLIRFIPN